MELQSLRLSNGIRLVHVPSVSQVAHCGIFIHAGSRHEEDHEFGIAHFIEHTIFKGTSRRNVIQVLNRLENVGADLNAYTTKEETVIHASFLPEFYGRTLDLLQDIFFHSTFPRPELEKEKHVVMDEIRSFRDNPEEQVFDDFEDMVFAGHPLGHNILGSAKSLKKLKQQDIVSFIRRNYGLEGVVIVSVGNISFKKLTRLTEHYFSETREVGSVRKNLPFCDYQPCVVSRKIRSAQVHCIIGAPAYDYHDERKLSLAVLSNLLGGPQMNSRLSLALRERNGLTYHNESSYTAFSDTGIIMIYFGTDPANHEKARSIVLEELKKLRQKDLGSMQLHTLRKQIIGQMAIARESNLATLLAVGKSYLLQDRYIPIESILKKISEIPAGELTSVAREIFDENRLSELTLR